MMIFDFFFDDLAFQPPNIFSPYCVDMLSGLSVCERVGYKFRPTLCAKPIVHSRQPGFFSFSWCNRHPRTCFFCFFFCFFLSLFFNPPSAANLQLFGFPLIFFFFFLFSLCSFILTFPSFLLAFSSPELLSHPSGRN